MKTACFGFVLLCMLAVVCDASDDITAEDTVPAKTTVQLKPEKKATKTKQEPEAEQLNLPEDTSAQFTVKELRISGNTLIPTDELLRNVPAVYNASDRPLHEAEPGDLYDLRALLDIIQQPGQPREVSRRAMQGMTEYILSVYHEHNYAGIYVYITAQAIQGGAELQDGLLPIEIVEAKISEITITAYNTEREKVEKPILQSSILEAWSPAKAGQVVNKKKLDDFVDLLNMNPDRYVSAVISRGSEPDSIALGYDIYEAEPWHYYIQLDNSGTEERQWAPRIGVINTNITGRDDKIAVLYQAPVESDFYDHYLAFGSYEFPLSTPRLRLNLYGGRSKFDTSEGINFLGQGSFYGSILRYNAFQKNGWFFDVTSSLSHEKSKVTPSLFPTMGTDVGIDLWGVGVNIYRSDDMSSTSFALNRVQSIGGSPQRRFWDTTTSSGARTNSDRHFNIYTVSAAHSAYLDPNKIHRLSGSSRWIMPNERLVPSKMTTFGGLYSVRGYKEDEIVADGGLLFSAQYEFDIIKHSEFQESGKTEAEETAKEPWLRRLALLAVTDFARAKTKNPVAGEKGTQELWSVGMGTLFKVGSHFDAGIYYGWPLRSTIDTNRGKGRWNFSFIMRW
ncbi:MAG: ShlB/FhaC/HecB family hemolysin secretion/activation protein [Planctomycetota bacterium]